MLTYYNDLQPDIWIYDTSKGSERWIREQWMGQWIRERAMDQGAMDGAIREQANDRGASFGSGSNRMSDGSDRKIEGAMD